MPLLDISNPLHPANIALSVVKSHIGSGGHAWVQSKTSVGSGAWCAATMVATGIDSNLAGLIFPTRNQSTPSGFQSSILCAGGVCESIVKTYNGTRIDGPAWGKVNVVPSPGDLIVFLWNGFRQSTVSAYKSGSTRRYWSGSHVGMVEYVEYDSKNAPTKVHTVEGNNGGTLRQSSYNINSECIAFYARPNWVKANGIASATYATTGTYSPGEDPIMSTSEVDGIFSTQLYTTESTKADASIREVAYLGKDGKPCINMTGVRLSVLNYTSFLSGLYKLQSGGISGIGGTPDNVDGLPTLPRTCVEYLVGKGFNTAAAIGIIANIKQESDFRTNCVGDKGTSFGICQWHNARGTAMKNFVGAGWESNLSGQLDFLIHELESSYPSLLSELKGVPNTLEGAKTAADRFVRVFERPANVDKSSLKRQANAENYWSMIVTSTSAESADYSSDTTVQRFPCPGTPYLVWPVESATKGVYSSKFGYRGNIGIQGASAYHSGVDIGVNQTTAANTDIPIKCCATGTVYRSYWNDARGWVIIINHGAYANGDGNAYTVYQHMKRKSDLAEGKAVAAGAVVGYVGNTGVGNYHLHLEVNLGKTLGMSGVEYYDNSYKSWRNHNAVDPSQYFPKPKGGAT